MIIRSAAGSSPGLIRKTNEDNYYLDGQISSGGNSFTLDLTHEQDPWHLYAVFDGMGGMENGEAASRTCAEVLKEYDSPELYESADSYLAEANEKVCAIGSANSGSTVVLAMIRDFRASVFNVGDSRAYICRDGGMIQLSRDHTRGQSMLDAGIFTPEELEKSELRHVLTQYLGVPDEEFAISPYSMEDMGLEAGDVILLCSDGLTDMCSEEEIGQILMNQGQDDPDDVVMSLIMKAIEHGGKDNITVIVIKVDK